MKFAYPPESKPIEGYTIRRGIHRGGFGEVYYGVSDGGKEVALKLLTHDLDTELRGIRQCLNLKHPNLVTIFDVRVDEEGDTWVIMEYVSGASLEDVLNAFPKGLPVEEVRDWMAGILAGTEYLHSRGIVHRDLKPANIYRENGMVKIGDVGLSKQMGATRRQHTEAVGTVYYMAPEVARGQYGAEVDVYSIGIILYELLTGQLPFNGETTGEILMKHLSSPPDLSLVSAHLRPLLSRALEKDPTRRIASIRQFTDELTQALGSQVAPVPNPSKPVGTADSSAPAAGNSDQGPQNPNGWGGWKNCGPGFWGKGNCAPKAASPVPPSPFAVAGDILGGVQSYVENTVNQALHTERDRIERWRERERARTEKWREYARWKEQKAADKAAKRARKEAERQARRSRPVLHGDRTLTWLPYFALAALFFIPWQSISWNDAGELAGIVTLWGFLLGALVYLTRPSLPLVPSDAQTGAGLPHPSHSSSLGWSRVERVSQSSLLALISASVLSAAGLSTWSLLNATLPLLGTHEYLWFGTVASAGTLLIVGAMELSPRLRTSHQEDTPRRLPFWLIVLAAVVLGVFANGLADFLEVRERVDGSPSLPWMKRLGQFPVAHNGHPEAMAYVLFFFVLFVAQSWQRHLSPVRPQRLQLTPVLWSAIIGFLVAPSCGLASANGVLWGAVIMTSAQLAAPWNSRASQLAA